MKAATRLVGGLVVVVAVALVAWRLLAVASTTAAPATNSESPPDEENISFQSSEERYAPGDRGYGRWENSGLIRFNSASAAANSDEPID